MVTTELLTQRDALIPPPDRDIAARDVRKGDVVVHFGQVCTVLVSHVVPTRPDRMYSRLSNGREGDLAANTPVGIYDGIRPLPIVAASPAYGWLIEPELPWDGSGVDVVVGPEPLCAAMRARLVRGEGTQRFRMGEHNMTYVVGRYLGPASMRHAPLIEYGHAWAGATWIDYEQNGSWTRVQLPLDNRGIRLTGVGHRLRQMWSTISRTWSRPRTR